MGQELECTMRYQRRTLEGKAYLETDHLLFRGEERFKAPLKDLANVRASDGALLFDFEGNPAALELGPQAERWAQKILNPPSRAAKLGIKPGLTVRIEGDFPDDFTRELADSVQAAARSKADLVFLLAPARKSLERLPKLSAGLASTGSLWVVYPKGVEEIREMDVLEAGRTAGLKDVKTVRFSATQTALRFVFPLAAR